MDNPKCPAKMPAKNTNVTPNEMPQIRTFPNPKPMADMSESMMTACKGECSTNKVYNQFKAYNVILLLLRSAKIGNICMTQ